MEDLKLSTMIDVLISTVGVGERMKSVNPSLHKALLPFEDKPILWHIINSIPRKKRIGILLGSRSDQIKDFCNHIFLDRDIQYIYVDDFTSEKSGTIYSLVCAKDFVGDNFWFLPCDGIFPKSILNHKNKFDTFYVQKVSLQYSSNYQLLKVVDEKVVEVLPRSTSDSSAYAFTGVMFIKNPKQYFQTLESTDQKDFSNIINMGSKISVTKDWIDLGNENSYLHHNEVSGVFDFTKSDQYTYILPKLILKWSREDNFTTDKMYKVNHSPFVFPANISCSKNFLCYEKVIGNSFYKSVSPRKFRKFLIWMKQHYWKAVNLNIDTDLNQFYKEKTESRIKLAQENLPVLNRRINKINGLKVQPWEDYLPDLNWGELIENGKTSTMHGDLQFDNIIYSAFNGFKLIDWRASFGSQKIYGDVYYDFAKLLGGIIINYAEVKKNNFSVTFDKDSAEVTLPTSPNSEKLIKILEEFMRKEQYEPLNARKLLPLIYWNMAPLHKEPFASALWLIGIYNFEKLRLEKI